MRLGAPLVEREDLIEGLVVAVTACADGEQVAVIEGPAGIGKSRLLEAVCERADEFEVLRARGGVLEQDIAFGVVRELLERRLVLASEAERQEVMTGAAVGAAPVLGLAAADGRRAGTGDLSGALHGLFWVVANLADRRPLLIAVDDLHWADRGSLEFLAFLARRIQGLPVFLATAVRQGEPSRREEAIAEILAHARVIRPAPLSLGGVAEVVEAFVGTAASPELVAACHAASGGNPFFLRELLTAIAPPHGDLGAVAIEAIDAVLPATVARDPAADRTARLAGAGAGARRRHPGGRIHAGPCGAARPAASGRRRGSRGLVDRGGHPRARPSVALRAPHGARRDRQGHPPGEAGLGASPGRSAAPRRGCAARADRPASAGVVAGRRRLGGGCLAAGGCRRDGAQRSRRRRAPAAPRAAGTCKRRSGLAAVRAERCGVDRRRLAHERAAGARGRTRPPTR